MTQSITSRFVCARSVPVRQLSSKRARRRSSARSRRAPSFKVCRDSPHPLVARAHASRHFVTQHAILSVIGREPDSRPSCSHMCNFNRTRQSITLVGSARRRARARACHWRFSAPSPRETSHVITRAHMRSTHDNRDDDDDHAVFEIRIAITMATTNSACCPSQTPSPSSLRARDHRYEADETQ